MLKIIDFRHRVRTEERRNLIQEVRCVTRQKFTPEGKIYVLRMDEEIK